MSRPIMRAVGSVKGGCGKTSTSLHLAGIAAERGLRPLVIDLDPELHLTYWLGHDGTRGLWEVFDDDRSSVDGLVVGTAHGIDLVPGSERLTRVDQLLHENPVGVPRRLQRVLEASDLDAYDLVLIDCPPNVGVLPIAAVAAAGQVIVPVQPSQLDRRGLVKMVQLVNRVAQHIRDDAAIVAAIPTRIKTGTNVAADLQTQLTKALGNAAVTSSVRDTVAAAAAVKAHAPIAAYDPRHALADDYRAVFDDLFPHL